MSTTRWVILFVPRKWGNLERMLYGEPFVVHEAPRGTFREVRLASEQETGLLARKALPAGKR